MSLYSDLNEVLTPYAQRIKNLRTDLGGVNDALDIQKNLTKFGEYDLSVTWESGRITGAGGVVADDYSIRSVGYITGIAGTTLLVSCNVTGLTTYAFLRIERYTEAGVFDSEGSVRIRATEMPATVAVASGYQYRLVWRMSDNSRTPLESDISITVKSEIEYMPASVKTVTDGLQDEVGAIKAGMPEFEIAWESGGINSAGNNNANVTNAYRSTGFVSDIAGKNAIIKAVPGLTNYFYLTIYKYDMTGAYVSGSAQIIYYNNMPANITFESGYQYRFMWRTNDESTITDEQVSIAWNMQIQYVPDAVANAIKGKRYNLGTASTLIDMRASNPFSFSPFREAVISFVWDGPYPDIDKVAALFKGYGYPICVGATPSFMYATANGLSETTNGYTVGMSIPEVLEKIVEDGGEIMVHPDGFITASNQYDYDAMYDYFIGDKERIESYGFTVYGQVRHGGEGVVTGTKENERWLIGNYEYGNDGIAVNYSLGRTNIVNTLANLKSIIDDAVTNKKWVRFMCHSLDSNLTQNAVSEEILTGLLDYIDTLGVSVETYHTMIDSYGSYRLSDLEDGIPYVFNGESNTPVRFDMDQIKPCHVSFDFQWTGYPEFYASAIYVPLCSIYGNMLKAAYSPRTLMFDSAIYRRCLIAAIDASNSIDSSNYACNISENEPFLGNPSFWMRYTGSVDSNTDVECVCTDSSITFRHSGNSQEIATVTFALTDTVDSLIAAINALTDFEASGIETAGKTCADLSIIKGITFPMHTNVTVSGVTTYDAPKINIPLLYNTAWHTCEIICDPNNNVAYVAIDGRTLQSTLKPLLHDGNKYIEIGGNYNNTGMPFKVKNIVINHGNFGDAEIVQSYVWPYESSKVQMISGKNPKLLLFEGHGITVGTDFDAPHVTDGDELSASTDRLNTVFSALKAKGYVPVTWEQIIDWKINGTSLPKRCYNIMMDDVQLENYVNHDKRIPFNKYNVMAGLAFITGRYGLSDTVTINGTTYTYADMIRIVNRAGWYIASHTANHTKFNELTPTAIDAELKASALSCDSVDVHSDLIIYPGGKYSNAMLSSLQRSVFKCGVGVAVDGYNCKMTNRYRLCRVEIGIRASLTSVLSQIV